MEEMRQKNTIVERETAVANKNHVGQIWRLIERENRKTRSSFANVVIIVLHLLQRLAPRFSIEDHPIDCVHAVDRQFHPC